VRIGERVAPRCHHLCVSELSWSAVQRNRCSAGPPIMRFRLDVYTGFEFRFLPFDSAIQCSDLRCAFSMDYRGEEGGGVRGSRGLVGKYQEGRDGLRPKSRRCPIWGPFLFPSVPHSIEPSITGCSYPTVHGLRKGTWDGSKWKKGGSVCVCSLDRFFHVQSLTTPRVEGPFFSFEIHLFSVFVLQQPLPRPSLFRPSVPLIPYSRSHHLWSRIPLLFTPSVSVPLRLLLRLWA
jgi:hypothetical protein